MVKAKRVYLKKVVKSLAPITKLKSKELINIVPLLTDDCIHKVCESCQNLLKNTYNFNDKTIKKVKKKLKSVKKEFRTLSKPKSSLNIKRSLLSNQQVGKGVFTILSSFILPALLASLTKK